MWEHLLELVTLASMVPDKVPVPEQGVGQDEGGCAVAEFDQLWSRLTADLSPGSVQMMSRLLVAHIMFLSTMLHAAEAEAASNQE